ncbi:MAG: hypothetical protein R2856_03135 [Caldilineaceae bacterium]
MASSDFPALWWLGFGGWVLVVPGFGGCGFGGWVLRLGFGGWVMIMQL